jgi:hypothetical protein
MRKILFSFLSVWRHPTCDSFRVRLYLTRLFKELITLLLPLVHIGLTGSVYLTVAVALERYTTVCHPFFKVCIPHASNHGEEKSRLGG